MIKFIVHAIRCNHRDEKYVDKVELVAQDEDDAIAKYYDVYPDGIDNRGYRLDSFTFIVRILQWNGYCLN